MALRVCENVCDQAAAIPDEDLVEPARPAETLVSRILECDRLLVVEDGIGRVTNSIAVEDIVGGELDVFGEKESLPTTCFFDNFDIGIKAST